MSSTDAVGPGGGSSSEHPDLAAAPRGVGSGEIDEAPPRRGDQPALGVVGAPVRPRLDGPDQRFLDGVLGGREVCPAVDEGRQDAGDQVPQLAPRPPCSSRQRHLLGDGRRSAHERPHLEPLVDRLAARAGRR